jgi:hypothetical protein
LCQTVTWMYWRISQITWKNNYNNRHAFSYYSCMQVSQDQGISKVQFILRLFLLSCKPKRSGNHPITSLNITFLSAHLRIQSPWKLRFHIGIWGKYKHPVQPIGESVLN